MAKQSAGKIKITLMRSSISCPKKHKVVLTGLGLRRRSKAVVREDTPAIRGMVTKVAHLVTVEKA